MATVLYCVLGTVHLIMQIYRITIQNNISEKKRRINVDAISFEKAVEQASWRVHHASENIIKAEIWHKRS